jgi:hypothetical protein
MREVEGILVTNNEVDEAPAKRLNEEALRTEIPNLRSTVFAKLSLGRGSRHLIGKRPMVR